MLEMTKTDRSRNQRSQAKIFLGMHFIQPPQHIVVKLVKLRRTNAISGRTRHIKKGTRLHECLFLNLELTF
jgi:hypothetical protein